MNQHLAMTVIIFQNNLPLAFNQLGTAEPAPASQRSRLTSPQ